MSGLGDDGIHSSRSKETGTAFNGSLGQMTDERERLTSLQRSINPCGLIRQSQSFYILLMSIKLRPKYTIWCLLLLYIFSSHHLAIHLIFKDLKKTFKRQSHRFYVDKSQHLIANNVTMMTEIRVH